MNIPKLDIHVHTMRYPELSMPRPNGENYATPDEIAAMYDKWGIDRGIILPEVVNECCYTAMTSEEACVISRERPDRFFWCCNLTPRMGENNDRTDFSTFLEHYKGLGAKGVGELCFNLAFDDPMTDNLFYHCERCDMPVIFHIAPTIGGCYGLYDEPGLPRMEKMLKKHPNLKFIGHSQPFWAEISGDIAEDARNGYPAGKVVEGRLHYLLRRYPNLYCDLSAGSGANAMRRDPEHAARFLGEFSDRVMFGTDICAPSNYFGLSEFLDGLHDDGKISDEVYAAVCRKNAIRVFRLGIE